ncbi:hypothetical protein GGI42DRAFT_328210 [Trichoderma sp. SZMC 28013]
MPGDLMVGFFMYAYVHACACVYMDRTYVTYVRVYIHLLVGMLLKIYLLFCRLVAQSDYQCIRLLGERM